MGEKEKEKEFCRISFLTGPSLMPGSRRVVCGSEGIFTAAKGDT